MKCNPKGEKSLGSSIEWQFGRVSTQWNIEKINFVVVKGIKSMHPRKFQPDLKAQPYNHSRKKNSVK